MLSSEKRAGEPGEPGEPGTPPGGAGGRGGQGGPGGSVRGLGLFTIGYGILAVGVILGLWFTLRTVDNKVETKAAAANERCLVQRDALDQQIILHKTAIAEGEVLGRSSASVVVRRYFIKVLPSRRDSLRRAQAARLLLRCEGA